ncbi:hypothetical protein [Paenibacillus chibensis]|uniref:hypothetical protein n=1 Tax=Paenibacillus chibensis TaxID=59846 RepID=UPI000FD9F10A|nr:hypothetical protein [Paenibacillus chibensis]MEC0372423.1 hypothetical protein [Paenibacillus chibensis]
MKQRITIENLNELTTEEKEKLRMWWRLRCTPGLFDLYAVKVMHDGIIRYEGPFVKSGHRDFNEDVHQGEALPLLSIGQMMELVQDNLENGFVIEYNQEKTSYRLHWTIPKILLPDKLLSDDMQPPDICDALWLATKTVLANV